MKRALVVLAALAAVAFPAGAGAHPLGNFTVNRFSAVELAGRDVYVHYVLDLAEIPTYQEGDRVRAPGFAGELGRGLVLEVGGGEVRLVPMKHKVTTRSGAGGLPTLRYEVVYQAVPAPTAEATATLVFHDTNFADRIGWREVVVRARDGAVLSSSSVPARSTSDELRAYPQDLLKAPLNVTTASAEYRAGTEAGSPPQLGSAAAPERARGGFEGLVARGELGAGVVLVSLLIAAFWGAAHALTPGHGKAIVAGYLVGSRGQPRHAVLLGAIVTATHTAGVFALGLVTLLLSHFVVPERLYPWLTVASGLLVIAVGASVLASRRRHRRGHGHAHAHHHGDEHAHETRGLLGIGVAAGLLPCPSALVVLLSAIALHRVGFGLALIVAFSLGLAMTITGIGLLAVLARRAFKRASFDGPIVRALPELSALVILVVGIGITAKALPGIT